MFKTPKLHGVFNPKKKNVAYCRLYFDCIVSDHVRVFVYDFDDDDDDDNDVDEELESDVSSLLISTN